MKVICRNISFKIRSTVTKTYLMFIINEAATCFDRILQSSSGRYKHVKGKFILLIEISVLNFVKLRYQLIE
jgi:hypothetical protein